MEILLETKEDFHMNNSKAIISFVMLLIGCLFLFATTKARGETLPPNQLMIQEPEMSPVPVRQIVFCEDCIIVEKEREHFVTAPHGVIKVMYTDGKGKPSPVYINPLEGYVRAGGEIFPFPAKLTTLDAYNPEVD